MAQNGFIVVDVQGFSIDNKLFPKEVSISIDDDIQPKTFIIQPPFNFSNLTIKEKITNIWLYNYFHGLCWEDGNTTLEELKDYLILCIKKLNNPIVYVKGDEKEKWIKQLIGEEIFVYNLDNFYCPNIRALYKTDVSVNVCNFHKKDCVQMCAEKSVILLRSFINSYTN